MTRKTLDQYEAERSLDTNRKTERGETITVIEQEYLDATNLAKLRIAKTILHDCLFLDPKDAIEQSNIFDLLTMLINALEEKQNKAPIE